MKIKANIPEILVGVFLTVAVFAMGMTFESSRHPLSNSVAASKTEQTKSADKPEPFTINWLTSDGAVFFTAVMAFIAFFQAGFFLRQLRLMKEGMEDARKVADATLLQARAAIALRLPRLRVSPGSLGTGSAIEFGKQVDHCYVDAISMTNIGEDKAFPSEVMYGWTTGNVLSPEPQYRFIEKYPVNSVVEPHSATGKSIRLAGVHILEEDQLAEIRRGNWLWFYCSIIYDDFMGEKHTHGFCWRWCDVGMGMDWRADDRPAYNRKT